MKAKFVYWTGRDRGGYCLVSLLIVWSGMSNNFFLGKVLEILWWCKPALLSRFDSE